MPVTSGIAKTGAKSSIGTTALQLTGISIKCVFGVLIKAASTNTGIVYAGLAGVTAGTADATDGMELEAGDAVLIEVDNADKVWVIGSAADQKVFWAAV